MLAVEVSYALFLTPKWCCSSTVAVEEEHWHRHRRLVTECDLSNYALEDNDDFDHPRREIFSDTSHALTQDWRHGPSAVLDRRPNLLRDER